MPIELKEGLLVPLRTWSIDERATEGDGREFDVVAIHGLGGDRRTTWTTTGDRKPVTWLTDFLPGRLRNPNIMAYEYSFQNKKGLVEFDIESKANDLLESLYKERERRHGQNRSLIFVGHDIGGVIMKSALLGALRTKKYAGIAAKTSLLVFFGTPHRATDRGTWERVSGNLISASGYGKRDDFRKILDQLSSMLKKVCDDFQLVSKIYKTISFFEKSDGSLPGPLVDQDMTRFGLEGGEKVFPLRRNHFELGRLRNDKEEAFKVMLEALDAYTGAFLYPRYRHLLEYCVQVPSSAKKRLGFPEDYFHCLRILHSLEIHSFKPKFSEADLASFREPREHPAYKQWLKGSRGLDMSLFIHGLKGSGRSSLASWAALRASESFDESVIIGFTFDSKDDRSRSTFQMYVSLSYQLLCLRPQLFDHVPFLYEELSVDDINGPCLKLDWLWSLFQSLVSCPNHGETICIINNVDECKNSGKRFLEDLFSLPRHPSSTFHLVLTSISRSKIHLKVPVANRINLEAEVKRGKDIEKIVKTNISDLIKRRPLYREFESDISEIVCRPSAALHEVRLIITLLDVINIQSTRSAVKRALDSMPRAEFDIHKHLLNQVHAPHLEIKEHALETSKTSSDWIIRAMYWIANAFRPLALGEISEAVAFEDDMDQNTLSQVKSRILMDAETDLKRILGRLIVIEDNRVSFAHMSWHDYLRDHLTPQSDSQHVPRFEPHFFMAYTCLEYISLITLESSQGQWSPQTAAENLAKTNPGLLQYAVQYWPSHYQKTSLDDKSRQQFLKFFKDESLIKLWSELFWQYQNPLTRREAKDSLSTAADVGCSDLVDILLENLNSKVAELWSALEVAIEAGQKELVQKLLASGAQNVRAVHSAAAHGRDKILPMLIKSKFPLFDPDNDGFTPLHVAARCGSLAVVKILLTEGGDSVLESRNKVGLTPLHVACQLGHADVVQCLLDHDANQDAVSIYGSTPLHLACKWQQPYAAETLLKKSQSSISAIDNGERLALHHAADTGRVDIVRMLLGKLTDPGSKDAHLEFQDDDWMTPLHIAADLGHSEVVTELIEQTTPDKPGATAIKNTLDRVPLHLAANNGHLQIVQCLLKRSGEQTMALDKSLSNPIHMAVQQGHLDIVKRICEEHKKRGYSLDVFNSSLLTPLHLACEKGDIAVVEALLESGAQAEITGVFDNTSLYTPLHIACGKGLLDVARALIRSGANPDAETSEGSTPLHFASKSGNIELARRLAHMSHINPRDGEGCLPIHLAASGGHHKLFKMLMHEGAEMDDNHRNGRTMLHYACEGGNVDLVRDILEFVYSDNMDVLDNAYRTPLHIAARAGHLNIVNELIIKGADPRRVDKDDSTPLMLATDERVIEKLLTSTISLDEVPEAAKIAELILQAADKGYTGLMAKLLEIENSSPDSVDESGRSALAIAAKRGHIDLVRLLQSKDAASDKSDSEGRTPVSYAAENAHCDVLRQLLEHDSSTTNIVDSKGRSPTSYAAWNGHSEAIKILRDFHANVNTVDQKGRSPLLVASKNNHVDTVKLLLLYNADPNAKDKEERTALHVAAHYGYSKVAEAFQSCKDRLTSANDIDKLGSTPMCTAAYNGHTDCIGVFLNMGLDKEKLGPGGWRPLHGAYDSLPIVRLLLKANADKDAVTNHGETTLSLAIKGLSWDVSEELLQNGASFLVPDEENVTPLHLAARLASIRLFRIMLRLLETDDINIRGSNGLTPFMEAARAGKVENVKAFLERDDVDVHATTNDNRSALWMSIEGRHDEVAGVILDFFERRDSISAANASGKSLEDLILHAASYGNLKILDRVWRLLKDPGNDERLFELVLVDDKPWLVDFLVSKNVYVDKKDKDGWNLKWISFANAIKDESFKTTPKDLPQCEFLQPDCWDAVHRMKGIDFVGEEEESASDVNTGASENSSEILNAIETANSELDEDITIDRQNSSLNEASARPTLHIRAREGAMLSNWRRRRPRDIILGIRANHPVPPDRLFYFEIKVMDPTAVIGIGFCSKISPLRRLPGWMPDSWGYHSDNGGLYHGSGHHLSTSNGTYDPGDVVGCGIDTSTGTAFFTKNGKRLKEGFTGITGRVYPTVGFRGPGEAIANFTEETEPFQYNLSLESLSEKSSR